MIMSSNHAYPCGKFKRRKTMKSKLSNLLKAIKTLFKSKKFLLIGSISLASVAVVTVTLVLVLGGNGNGNGDGGDGSYDYTWSKTELLLEMNAHNAGGELQSGVRRYYAGADSYAVDDIDDAIRQRNKNAASNTNVKPKYTYLADGVKEHGWGANVGRIQQLTNVGGSNCPDIFVNHAYDLTCAQIRGCFANLLDKSWELGNHFYFANNEIPETEDYFDSEAGKGYFYEYMKSLSLTPDTKIYCLGSNYCIDLVRAFLVIPVNVDLMNSINTTEVLTGLAGDRDGDGDHDIVDFYELVWNNEWTYNALAAYCNIVFRAGNGEDEASTDFGDEVVGFILGTNSGLTGAAMLYTTSVKIINYNETTQKYEYPETNADLTAFAEALSDLMTENSSKGICTVDRGIVNKYDSAASSELIGIRHKFANNGVLFGGTIMVGSLEDADYQAMRDGSGFGVVPVPLYKPYEENTNFYQTLVHNMARIVAVSACSTEKSQASAFLDYMSRNSADILEEYYTVQLAAKVGGVAGENNVKMLTYIRNHVRTCFDKTFEDAIADYMLETDSGAYGKRWHYMLQTNKFSMPGISTQYYAYYLEKQKNLDTIYDQWNSLK